MINSQVKIIFSRFAQIELQDVVNWYNKRKKGLGKQLKLEVKRVIDTISFNPTFASIKYDNTLVVACNIFPYTIHYEIDEEINTIRIIAIFHTKRKPSWQ